MEEPRCPQCDRPMEFRLGAYECPDCGTQQPRQQSVVGAAPLWEGDQPGAEDRPAYARIGLKEDHEPEIPVVQREKPLFMLAFVLVQVILAFQATAQSHDPLHATLTLMPLIGLAVFSTVGVGAVLYMDNACIKNGVLFLVSLSLLFWLTTLYLAWRTEQLGLAGSIVLYVLVFGWLANILYRESVLE